MRMGSVRKSGLGDRGRRLLRRRVEGSKQRTEDKATNQLRIRIPLEPRNMPHRAGVFVHTYGLYPLFRGLINGVLSSDNTKFVATTIAEISLLSERAAPVDFRSTSIMLER